LKSSQPFALLPELWRQDAACKGYPVDWWYPEKGGEHETGARARRICGACPVRQECLDQGIAHNEPGIWGGLSIKERRRLRQEGRDVLSVLVCQYCRNTFMRPVVPGKWYMYCSHRCRRAEYNRRNKTA
jgi:hypothetical protein